MDADSNGMQSSSLSLDTDQQPGNKKRNRAPNYTDKEIRTLIRLIFTHLDVVENKKTDSETWRIKCLVWNSIMEDFNRSDLGSVKRTAEMLRQKYDSIKKWARKKEAKNREEESKPKPDYVHMEDYEKELLHVLETHGGNSGQPCESTTTVHPPLNSVKFENGCSSLSANDDSNNDFQEERFIVTDEDMLWDLPADTTYRPRLNLVKKQLEHLEREEQRQLTEHHYRMRTEEIKRKIYLNKGRRARIEHRKKMEILELEIELKKKALMSFEQQPLNS
ncbi:unnamed protein product [Ceutorhynchus assimilis]|uniref:Regulatory protein zeste n=1 Tax=Ceutorhynchus assimilis TaxID=467358 RepID=A0A9N9QQQ5_9CUCU|nr:unnamed protein product [Ceutorhynchus assimilis]